MLRRVKSFVLRQGRLTARQENALKEEGAAYLLTHDDLISGAAIFGREAPIILEIGFGMGHSLLKNAISRPDIDFIGIEVHTPGVGALLAELKAQNIQNVRVFHRDAVEVLQRCIPDQFFSEAHIFFPDPWPKRRHHKRRLIQPAFVHQWVQKVKVGGLLHLATDWEDYATQMLRVLSAEKLLTQVVNEAVLNAAKAARPLTKYEQRGHRLGHAVWDWVFERVS